MHSVHLIFYFFQIHLVDELVHFFKVQINAFECVLKSEQLYRFCSGFSIVYYCFRLLVSFVLNKFKEWSFVFKSGLFNLRLTIYFVKCSTFWIKCEQYFLVLTSFEMTGMQLYLNLRMFDYLRKPAKVMELTEGVAQLKQQLC
ncbi:Hypothetical_protein [Hexamita inflata]|uniref:Hypothetical_protein n=1 Tax=Hexamita inflata TaxID=28002 RepID=A0AA86TRA1_9EUKA|nr:Hypothetical protein HINF_LOCUS11417 [Hexamita inflata]